MARADPPRPPAARHALIIGASGGIGSALAATLRTAPNVDRIATLSRSANGLDLLDESSVARAAAQLKTAGAQFDLIINAVGILEVDGAGPEKSFKELSGAAMLRAFAVNAVGAALALKHFVPLLKRNSPTVYATLSARVGSIGDNWLGGWMSYRASKAALNQVVRCAAIEDARRNKQSVIVAIHPGTIKTPLTVQYARGRYTATPEEAAQNILAVLARLSPAQSGGFFDYAGREIEW